LNSHCEQYSTVMSCINQNVGDPVLYQATSNEQFLKQLRESWERPYEESAFLKDIPRLVRRVHVQSKTGAMHAPPGEEVSKVEAIVMLVELVSGELDVEHEAAREIRKEFDRCVCVCVCVSVRSYRLRMDASRIN
jgi:hypothetical protein